MDIMDLDSSNISESCLSSFQGGEVMLSLAASFLKTPELRTLSMVNKHLRDMTSRYIYDQLVQQYPAVSLNGPPPSNSEMVQMYVPPRIVLCPRFSPESMLRWRATYNFPMPASQQPQIHCDPRLTNEFESMTWSEKTGAIRRYVALVESWYLSVTAHRAEEHEDFASTEDENARVMLGQPIQEMLCVLSRALVLNRDLECYPFFLQGLTQEEASKVKVCFYEKIIKATVGHGLNGVSSWSIFLCRELLTSLPGVWAMTSD